MRISSSRIPVSPSLVLLVQNDAGYRNLCILLSRAAKEGFVNGMPHIESRLLESCHEGLDLSFRLLFRQNRQGASCRSH